MNYRACFFATSGILLAGLTLGACGVTVVSGSSGGAGGAGGSTTGTAITGPDVTTGQSTGNSMTTTSTGVMTGPGTSTTGSGQTCPATPPLSGPCAPKVSCPGFGSRCLSQIDQSGTSTFGLRVAQLRFKAPAALTKGLVSSVLESSASPNQPACNLNGSATLSWLLQFDLATNLIVTGGAKPSMSASGPYHFVDELVSGVQVAPAKLGASLASGCAFSSSAADLNLPIYLDAAATQAVVLPLRQMTFHDGVFSSDHGCIGRFNAEGLDPANSCLADNVNPAFTDGAAVDGFFNLEEADHIVVSSLNETLCVLFSGNQSMYGTQGPAGINVCKRDGNNTIIFQGDWCTASNSPATDSCSDALRFSATFAAQGVNIQ
jgi:hypothetical protein